MQALRLEVACITAKESDAAIFAVADECMLFYSYAMQFAVRKNNKQ